MRYWSFALGIAVLVLVWAGPLPLLARQGFSAHMAMHVCVIGIAAPLVAFGLAGSRYDPVRASPALFAPIPASVLELAVVWGWHAPAPHHAARADMAGLILEQGSFLAAGLLIWLSALGGDERVRHGRAAAAIGGLLLTSMHMTLLGVLLTLASRPLYHARGGLPGLTPLQDQQLGGVMMLLVGGLSYLVGGLYLLAGLLEDRRLPEEKGAKGDGR